MQRRLTTILLALLIAGCSGPPATSPSAGTSPAPTLVATAPPSPTASPGEIASSSPAPTTAPSDEPSTMPAPDIAYPDELRFANEFAMRVVVGNLNVRAKPTTSGAKLGKAPKGAVFLVLDWPVRADGYTWYFGYQALLAPGAAIPELPKAIEAGIDPIAGWIAAGTSGTTYLKRIAARCPTVADLDNLEAMLNSETIGCFGSTSIELTGTSGCGGCGGTAPGDWKPDWLTYPLSYGFLSISPELRIGPFSMRFPPDGPAMPKEGTIIRVRGHFADTRSANCRIAPLGANDAPDPIATSVALAYCRAQFVVESYDSLGPNPSFPG